MARFFIYIPGDDRADPRKLDAVGLKHLKAGANFIPAPEGPDGKRGVVISWPHNSNGPVAFMSQQQEWFPSDADGTLAAGRYWIGFTKGALPTPVDLVRDAQFNGSLVTLGDGFQWRIPAAGMLPKKSQRDSSGTWSFVVRQQFAQYWQDSCEWRTVLACIFANSGEAIAERMISVNANCCDYLTRALSINYLIVPEIVSRLELFGTDTILPALLATVDGAVINEQEFQKKTEQPPLDT